MKLTLINKKTEEVIEVTKEVSIIGRSSDCDVSLNIMTISRRHLRLTKGDNTINIVDLGSKNHTYIPGKALLEDGSGGTVKHGDTITIGKTDFIIQINGQQLPDDDEIKLEPDD